MSGTALHTWRHTAPQDCEVMKLSEWDDLRGEHPQTAHRWFREGILPARAQMMSHDLREVQVTVNAA